MAKVEGEELDLELGEPERDETPAERLDRNLNEMLQELRVALPGVQVLFAFLLTVPFSQGLTRMTHFERDLYMVVLLATALATFILIAPTTYHRFLFRQGRKAEIVAFTNRAILVGLAVLAFAMVAAVLLVTHLLFGAAAAIPITVITGAVITSLWYGFPYLRSRERGDSRV
jgi:Family of unknown function (DUF6328)